MVAFENGTRALESLKSLEPPDMIIMDLTFPQGTPEDFVEAMRSLHGYSEIPVILISGRADVEEFAVKFKSSGYLRKPFDIDQMIDVVKGCL